MDSQSQMLKLSTNLTSSKLFSLQFTGQDITHLFFSASTSSPSIEETRAPVEYENLILFFITVNQFLRSVTFYSSEERRSSLKLFPVSQLI